VLYKFTVIITIIIITIIIITIIIIIIIIISGSKNDSCSDVSFYRLHVSTNLWKIKTFLIDADLTDSVVVSYHGCTNVELTSRSEARDYIPQVTIDQLTGIIITCIRMRIGQGLTVQMVACDLMAVYTVTV